MFKTAPAICYSGYRENQSPREHNFPSEAEVLEDLMLLSKNFKYIRMYDPYDHAKTVLHVIKTHQIDLKVMLGVEPRGEISNPNCPWGGLHSDEEILYNKTFNFKQLDELAQLCNTYGDIVLAASVGNENTSSWHHNLMKPETIASYATYLKGKIEQPVTFCEGAYNWISHGHVIAEAVDFISIHSYPVWLKTPLKDAVSMTIKDYEDTVKTFPGKPVVFTEFGWATMSNGPMLKEETNEAYQKMYLDQIMPWAKKNNVTMFIFEAFDEPWKGSDQLDEPEKHWG
ncbi:MAG TPA: glycosyl hydrolase, partial [Acholeplasmataceae bacterium]|nr:glycosyl hydrolase [Acholeplasmataceae bacterium]